MITLQSSLPEQNRAVKFSVQSVFILNISFRGWAPFKIIKRMFWLFLNKFWIFNLKKMVQLGLNSMNPTDLQEYIRLLPITCIWLDIIPKQQQDFLGSLPFPKNLKYPSVSLCKSFQIFLSFRVKVQTIRAQHHPTEFQSILALELWLVS